MKEKLFNVVRINEDVVFRFYAMYHYNGAKKLVDINLHLENFNLAIGTESKRITLVPDFDYNIEAKRCSCTCPDEYLDEFIKTECLKIFKLEPTKLFKFLLTQNLYRFTAITSVFNQLRFKREDEKDFDYKDSIRDKNASVCGISYSTILATIPTILYNDCCKERNLFNQDLTDLERKTVEIDIDHALKIPSEISFYCKENPYQLELDFGENYGRTE